MEVCLVISSASPTCRRTAILADVAEFDVMLGGEVELKIRRSSSTAHALQAQLAHCSAPVQRPTGRVGLQPKEVPGTVLAGVQVGQQPLCSGQEVVLLQQVRARGQQGQRRGKRGGEGRVRNQARITNCFWVWHGCHVTDDGHGALRLAAVRPKGGAARLREGDQLDVLQEAQSCLLISNFTFPVITCRTNTTKFMRASCFKTNTFKPTVS